MGMGDGLIQVNFSLSSTYRLLTGSLVCWDTDIPSISPSQIWDITRKCISHMFEGHQDLVYSLDFSHNGSFIVSGLFDGRVWIWNMNTCESKVFPIPNHPGWVRCVDVSPDDRFVTATFQKGVMHIWNVETMTLIDSLRGHDDVVCSVDTWTGAQTWWETGSESWFYQLKDPANTWFLSW